MAQPVRLRIAAVLVAVTALLFGAAGRAVAIAHGTTVPVGTFPFAVKLLDIGIPEVGGGLRNSSCSGALISPHWVLTAGHCFKDEHGVYVSHTVARKSTATVGRTNLTLTTGHVANVVQVKQNGNADISLARLDQAITDVKPARIARSKPRDGEAVRLAGWGQVTVSNPFQPQQLQTGQFHVQGVGALTVGMVGVSPKPDTSPCPHDSGGPYFTQAADGTATVVGVVSHGPDCPHFGPDTAARVDAVAAWIQSVIGSDKVAAAPPSTSAPSPVAPAAAAVSEPAPATDKKPSYLLVAGAGGGVLVVLVVLIVVWRRGGKDDKYRGRRRNAVR